MTASPPPWLLEQCVCKHSLGEWLDLVLRSPADAAMSQLGKESKFPVCDGWNCPYKQTCIDRVMSGSSFTEYLSSGGAVTIQTHHKLGETTVAEKGNTGARQ